MDPKNKKIVIILGAVLLLAIGGYFGYKYFKRSKVPNVTVTSKPETKNTTPKKDTVVTSQPVTQKTVPTDQELIDGIRKDIGLGAKDSIVIEHKNADKPTLENRLYVVTPSFEVVSAAYGNSMHVVARPISGGIWKSTYSAQNSYECKELDKLGFTRAQTIEWKCFEYDKQVYRK